jgi:hypothetical protein
MPCPGHRKSVSNFTPLSQPLPVFSSSFSSLVSGSAIVSKRRGKKKRKFLEVGSSNNDDTCTELVINKHWFLSLALAITIHNSCRRSLVSLGGYIVNSLDYYSWRLIGKLTAFLELQEFSLRNRTVEPSTLKARGLPGTGQSKDSQYLNQGCSSVCQLEYRRCTYHITLGYSPISLTGVSLVNLVSIFRCSSSADNRGHPRHVDSSNLVFNPFITPKSIYSFCL